MSRMRVWCRLHLIRLPVLEILHTSVNYSQDFQNMIATMALIPTSGERLGDDGLW